MKNNRKKIYVDIRDDIPTSLALQVLHLFVADNDTGITFYKSPLIGSICVTKRDYRKNDCYVVFKDNGGHSDE